MSDKVQLIKQEIERRIENLSYLIPDISNIGNLTMEDVGYYAKSEALKSILQFIDSLPEESESKDRINECPHWEKYWGCETSPMNNCDSCPQAKWVEVKEEKKNYNERYKRIAQTEQFKTSYRDKSLGKEDSACEDLEEEIDRYYSDWQFDDDTIYEDMRNICRHFAEWQKQQMMKALVNGEVVKDIHSQLSVKSEPLNDTFRDVKFGDKVKIIIVKED